MVVFDLEQTHIVRGVTIANPEKWTVNYKWNSDDPLIWLSEGREARSETVHHPSSLDMPGFSHKVRVSPPAKSATSASQVNNDLVARLGAADQQVAVSRKFEWLWLITDGAGNQPAFAAMTDPCPARPPHWNIAGLGEFEQALERRIPVNEETTASERDQRPRAGRTGRQVRWEARCIHHAGCAGWTRTEYLCVHMVRGDTPGSETAGQILQERRRSTQIEIRLARHTDLLEHRHTEVSSSVEVQTWLILGTWPAVEDVVAAVGQRLEAAA